MGLENAAIDSPTDESAQYVSDFLLNSFPSMLNVQRSSIDTVDNGTLYPIEFINKLIALSFSLHIFKLKKETMHNVSATHTTSMSVYMIVLLKQKLVLVLIQDQLC